MPGSIIEVTLALIVFFFVGLWLRGKMNESRKESVDERDARDADVNKMVNSALGSRPRRREARSEDGD